MSSNLKNCRPYGRAIGRSGPPRLITGKAIFENLNRKNYDVPWVEMTKENKFEFQKRKLAEDF